jgi:hypothetical protein
VRRLGFECSQTRRGTYPPTFAVTCPSMAMGALRLAAAMLLGTLLAATPAVALRPIPNTRSAIHVWDDQLPDDMTPAQISFVARHVDGTQKVSLQTAKRLRARNARFLVLHYRLGIGDGPVPFRIGSRWATDYGTVRRHPSWFWHEDGRRVLNTQSDWYLMNPDSGWRSYWARRVLYEARLRCVRRFTQRSPVSRGGQFLPCPALFRR